MQTGPLSGPDTMAPGRCWAFNEMLFSPCTRAILSMPDVKEVGDCSPFSVYIGLCSGVVSRNEMLDLPLARV